MVAGIRCLVQHFIIEEGRANDDTFTRKANVFSGLETASKLERFCGLNAHTIKLRRNDYNECWMLTQSMAVKVVRRSKR